MKLVIKKKYNRVIRYELNEISHEIIFRLAENSLPPSLSYINQYWNFLQTTPKTGYGRIESGGQWVSAHARRTLAEHETLDLSDEYKPKSLQTRETLNQHSLQSTIIGSMNAIRGEC